MEVIAAGLPRCGTSALQAALESPSLGFSPCAHMAHIIPSPRSSKLAIQALQETDWARRRKILHQIFDGFRATTDFRGVWFIDDLMDMYPEAKVVLNQREGGTKPWSKSMMDNLAWFASYTYIWTCLPIQTNRLHRKISRLVMNNCNTRWDYPIDPGFYDYYQDYVLQEAAKRGREVLVWKPSDGWKPLCNFLECEEPVGQGIPRINDAATMSLVKKIFVARWLATWATIFGSAYMVWPWALRILSNYLR